MKRAILKMHPGKVYEFTEKELLDLRRFGLVAEELDDEPKAEERNDASAHRAAEPKQAQQTVNKPAPRSTDKK